MNDPSHKKLIDQYLDWNKVNSRLAKYKNIGNQYDIRDFKKCSNKAPYYCHYLAWRLGTWEDEKIFALYDELLDNGSTISNWKKNNNLLKSPNFDDFWGLVWELQVAKLLSSKKNVQIEWMKSGPDLKITTHGNSFFIECYTYRKSFGIEEFISELFSHIHPKIRATHIRYTNFVLPKDKDIEVFLDEVFKPFLDSKFLSSKINESKQGYPVLLPLPKGSTNFYIYIEGTDPNNYIPGRIPTGCGNPEQYLNVAIKEALDNKRNSNRLIKHRPNILAVNFLLGGDFQTAFNRQINTLRLIPTPYLGTTFDGIFFAACGIDEIPSFDKIFSSIPDKTHPIKSLLE